MTTVQIDIDQLDAALRILGDLASNIDTQRGIAASGTPISLPTLDDGHLGRTARWLEEQKPVLRVRRDIAVLLSGKTSGTCSYDIADDTFAASQQLLATTISDKIDSLGPDADPDDVSRVTGIMRAWQGDPQVMQLLFGDLGARGTARAMAVIQEGIRFGSAGDELHTLAMTLRTGLQSATRSPYFDSTGFGRELVRQLVAPLLTDDEQRWQEEHGMMGMSGASSLAFLLAGRGYGADFLVSAGNTLVDFEKRCADGSLPASYWYGHNGYGPLNSGSGYADPMAVLLKSMSGNAQATGDFLSDKATRDFLFDQRDFSDDGYAGVSALADTASTDPALVKRDPEMAALIASEFVHEIADSPGFNPDDAKAASASVAHLLASYMPSVATALDGPGGVGDPGLQDPPLDIAGFGRIEDLPLFYRKDLAALTGVAMGTKDGMGTMAAGVADYQQTQVNAIAAQLADRPNDVDLRTQLNSVLKDRAELDGFTTKIAGQTQIDDAYSTDQQRAAWIKLVSDAAGAVPIKPPGVGFVVGEGLDWATSAATEEWAHTSKAATDNAIEQATDGVARLNYQTYTSLVEADVIPRKDVPDSFFADDGTLKSWADIAGTDHAQSYSEAAAQGMKGYISDEDLETTYRSRFQDFYDDPGGS